MSTKRRLMKSNALSMKQYILIRQYITDNIMPSANELQDHFPGKKNTIFHKFTARFDYRKLDEQMILKKSGKIVIPRERFVSVIKEKLNHLKLKKKNVTVNQTIEAISEEYTIGEDNYGMSRVLIAAIVQACNVKVFPKILSAEDESVQIIAEIHHSKPKSSFVQLQELIKKMSTEVRPALADNSQAQDNLKASVFMITVL